MHAFIEVLWILKNIFIAIAGVAIIFYTAWYSLLSSWRKYPAGRSVLGFVSSLVAVLVYTILALFDDDSFYKYPAVDPSLWRIIIGFIVYGAVAYATIRLDITLVSTWIKGERPAQPSNPFIPEERTDLRARRAEKKRSK